MNLIRSLRVFMLVCLSCSLGAAPAVLAAQSASLEPDTFVIGVISSNPKKAVKRTAPLAQYIAARLGEFGITKSKVVVAPNSGRMVTWLRQGRVDMVSESVLPSNILIQGAGAEVLAKRWKGGIPSYQTIFFSRKDSGVNSFSDLVGKVIVFEDRDSTSAYFIPAYMLLRQGYELFELTSPREKPPAGKVGYLFADELTKDGGEINMYSWVYNGIVSAAAFSSHDWDRELPDNMRENLALFQQSRSVPRTLELSRAGMPPELKAKLQDILFDMHNNEEGRAALERYKNTSQFEPAGDEVDEALKWAQEVKSVVDESLVH